MSSSLTSKKVVLLTGASSGIGRVTAELLVERGYIVYGVSRNKPKESFNFNWLALDVSDINSITKGVSQIISQEKSIDILINNAGISLIGSVENSTTNQINALMNCNLLGVIYLIQQVLPLMKKHQSGTIINISSIGGLIGLPFQGIYCASKFAMEGLSESLRMELHQLGIKVVLIEPGDLRTSITKNRQINAIDKHDHLYQQHFARTKNTIEKDEYDGGSPEIVARLICKIIHMRKPKVRYTVGKQRSQLIAPMLKKVLPSRVFEKFIRGYYFNG